MLLRFYIIILLSFGLLIQVNSGYANTTFFHDLVSTSEIENKRIVPPPNADAGQDKRMCLKDSVQIGGNPTGPTGATYQWSNSGSLSDETSPNPKASPSVTTTYTVTVTDGANGTATDQVTVTVDPLPHAFSGFDRFICEGTSTNLGDTVAVDSTNNTYVWSNSHLLSSDTVFNPIASPLTATVFVLTVTSPNGCTSIDSTKVTVRSTPKVNTGPDRIICNGSPVQLGGMPTGPFYSNYLWDNTSTLNNELLSNPTASPSVTTVYTVTVSHTGPVACTNTGQVTVYVDSFPPIDAGNDTIICRGNPAELGGSPTFSIPGATYKWNNQGSLDSRTSSNPTATPFSTTTYTVTVTDDASLCTATSQVTVTVDSRSPTAEAGADSSICFGESVVLGGNSAGTEYIWDIAGSLNDTSIANPTATPDTTTTYKLLVLSSSSCTATDEVTITVDTFPVADAGQDDRFCQGDSRVIGNSASANAQYSYTWNNASSLNNSMVASPTADPLATTTYTVTVSNGTAGCTATDQVTLNVDSLPIANAGSDTAICKGASFRIGRNPSVMHQNIVISWSPKTGLSDSTLANPMASPQETTTYTLVVRDTTTFCSNTDQITVTVDSVPIANAGRDTTICEKDTVSIGSSAILNSAYQWSNSSSLIDASASKPLAIPSTTTIYTVTVTNLVNCSATDQVEVTVNQLPNINAGSDKELCFEDTLNLGGNPTSNGVNDTYLWSNTSNLNDETLPNPKAFPSDTSSFSLTVTSDAGCVAKDTITINVIPSPIASFTANSFCEGSVTSFTDNSSINMGSILNWEWDFGDGSGFSFSNNPSYAYANDGSYEVQLIATSQLGCKDSITQTIAISPKPSANAGSNKEICITDSVEIGSSSNDPNTSFSWSPVIGLSNATIANPKTSPTNTTNYIVTVTDQLGCVNYDTVEVVVNNLPIVTTIKDTLVCVDQSTKLITTGANTYSWSPAVGLDNSAIADPTASLKKSRQYIVTGTDLNGCENKDTVAITVFNVDFYSNDTTICNDSELLLDPIIEGEDQGITYQWTPGTKLSNTTIKNPLASPVRNQQYILEITNPSGCTDKDSILINLNGELGLAIELETELQCKGAIVKAINKSSNADEFEWYLNETLVSEEMNASFEINNRVDNMLMLVGFSYKCIDTLHQTIESINYDELLKLDKPNIFTPNGDGVNDEFDPIYRIKDKPIGCIGFEYFQVYNRWGRLIFETDLEDQLWDGQNMEGDNVEAGQYYYLVKVGGTEIKGSVVLSR